MPEYTQEHRRISIETPLGKDVLLLAGFSGHEGLSQPFHFHVDLLSADDAIKPADIVGKNVSFKFELLDGSERWFNGYVSRFAYLGTDDRLSHYDAEVVPWLWFLDRTADCKIFQEKTVLEIIAEVFGDHGIALFDTQGVIGSHPTREYCVQYRETDFAFVSRLMEEEGIFYYFEHDSSQHKMVLADHKGAYEKCAEGEVEFRTPLTARDFDEMILSWEHRYEYRSGKIAHTDYNFKTPSAPMDADSATVVDLERIDSYELYDYPGVYTEKSAGQDLAKIRMEEEETPYELVQSRSKCRTYFAGGTFTIKEHHSSAEEGKEYVITSIGHSASAHDAYQVGGEEAPLEYTNEFQCIPAAVQFRPARTTAKPVIRGIQTAVVVGPSGEEIYTDKYGRIKVQFHWDRYSKADENSSCWIRVAQSWAGKKWGAIFLPRIGHEVVIDFLEGDPDRPIVTGSVYNEAQTPPYELPGQKTKSTIKSLSSKGGGGFNEIRLEDKKGEEQVFVHAEKNQDNRVKNDSLEWIGNDRHLIVVNDQLEQVDGDKHLTVKGDQNENVDGTISVTAGADVQEKVGMNYALDAGMEVHIKAGLKVVIEAGAQVSLKVGGSFVDINPGGVFITGPMVMINSGGSAGSGSGASPDTAKAPKEADTAEPGEMVEVTPKTPPPPAPAGAPSPAAAVLKQAAEDGTPFCEQCAKAAAEKEKQSGA